MGAGVSLAAACDMVVSSSAARYASAFVKVGLLPDTGVYWSLAQRVGGGRARELMMRAREFDGVEALQIGSPIGSSSLGQARATALAFAGRYAALPAVAIAHLKAVLGTGSIRSTGYRKRSQSAAHPAPQPRPSGGGQRLPGEARTGIRGRLRAAHQWRQSTSLRRSASVDPSYPRWHRRSRHLDNPGRATPWGGEMRRRCAHRPSLDGRPILQSRALVLTGAGSTSCAGADIPDMAKRTILQRAARCSPSRARGARPAGGPSR